MENLLLYLLRSALCTGVMYTAWLLFMSRDTFFTVNRFYLFFSVLLSLIFPLFDFTSLISGNSDTMLSILNAVTIRPENFQENPESQLSVIQILLVIYLTGAGIFFLRFIIQLFQIFLLVKKFGVKKDEGLKLVLTDSNYAPFSFFGLIFLNSKFSSEDRQKIIVHEKIHINQFHSLDLLLLEVMTIILWFNPFTWLMRKSIKSVHEYLADEGVLLKGFDRNGYQQLLLSMSLGIQVNDLTNNIHKSFIKRRFEMMNSDKTKINSSLKYLFIFPLLFVILLSIGANKPRVKFKTWKIDDSVYVYPDVRATFVGGDRELQKFIINNVKYPEECKKNGIEGWVAVNFVITKEGKVTNIRIAKSQPGKPVLSLNPDFEKEALRVISLMPDWIPGQLNGKPVDTFVSIPFNFKLSKD